MALVMNFTPTAFTATKYNETLKKLEAAGVGSPKGRLYHVCFGSEDNLRVTDIWESQEEFDAFGQTLIPIMTELGVDPGQPEIATIYNIIKG